MAWKKAGEVRLASAAVETRKPAVNSDAVSAPTGDDYEWLKSEVELAYDEGVSMERAERLAAKCLGAQLRIAERLATADLDARMKKNGLKTVKANAYMRAATSAEKKPTESMIDAMITQDKDVANSAEWYDRADAEKESLTIYLGIFRDAHIYFRGIAKGRYDA